MERLQVEAGTLRLASIGSQLEEHEFSEGIRPITWVERAALGLAPRARLLEERVSRKNRTPCSTLQSSACSRMATIRRGEPDQRFGQLTEFDESLFPIEAGLDHHLLGVVRPAFDH